MENKKKVVSGLITLFISLPIWYFLLYNVLKYVQASELMWFLYWGYVPLGIFAQILGGILTDDD